MAAVYLCEAPMARNLLLSTSYHGAALTSFVFSYAISIQNHEKFFLTNNGFT